MADRCVFVMGPARSGTTILAQLINGSDRAFLTTEGYYFLAQDCLDFRRWYNEQHRGFGNQVSKTSYAPNFGHRGETEWWKWLARASEHYELVGDKMAFSDAGRCLPNSIEFMDFFESRFFRSKYIFTFRDPVQSVLSSVGLWKKDPVAAVVGWASFVKLWADFIRVFPATVTLLLEQLDAGKVGEIGDFLGLDLTRSTRLLDPREQRQHQPQESECGEFISRVAPLLQMIFSEIKEAVSMDRILLQADQKRTHLDGWNYPPGKSSSEIAIATTPVGRAWNLADRLVSDLQEQGAGSSSLPS